ncbi:MAG: XRE family transcriptional regulator [Candidatus Omnitrophica bacterium]|nr:XRE family transcriptional regulator [Candidatus Omnitrophota bacterium]
MEIGKQLRELRKKRGLTLLELSKKSGVALATLSRIETGKMTGTLKSHINIAKALDMTLPEFYSDMDKPTIVQREGDYADLFVYDNKTSSVILTKDVFNKKMLPTLIKIERGGKTHSEQLKKGTEKFMYILGGKIEVVIGKERHMLGKGATLYFDASHSHYARNVGNGDATCICVVTPAAL